MAGIIPRMPPPSMDSTLMSRDMSHLLERWAQCKSDFPFAGSTGILT
jgi:hypothetical protein